jgi:putative ABC transport system permease protein
MSAAGERVYRLLLRVLPGKFRARFGEEMVQCFRAWQAEECGRRGKRAVLRVWWLALTDLAATAWRERLAAVGAARSHRTVDVSPGGSMTSVIQDVRYALRTLRRSPPFVAVVVLSLALGMGANSLIYSVVDGVVFHPFRFPEAARLVLLGATYPKFGGERRFIETFAAGDYADVERQSRTLEDVFAFDLGNRNLSGGDRPERVFTAFVWGDPIAATGTRPWLGRGFTEEEWLGTAERVAVLSHRVWLTRFGADSSLLGRTIEVDGAPVVVVGVLPPELLLVGTDLWLPMGAAPATIPREARQWAIGARLAPGVALDRANAELATIARRTEQAFGREREEYTGWRLEAAPIAEALTGEYRPAAAVLLGAVALVLLIACANIASLMLARAATRRQELAVRRALGAGRWRLVRQLFTESLILAWAGAAAGLLVAYGLIGPTLSLFPEQIREAGVAVSIDRSVIAYTLALATLSALIVGVAPAVQATRGSAAGALTAEGTRLSAGAGGRRLRHGFVVAELALALVLLAGAGLLGRSFARLRSVEPGFDTRDVLTMRLTLPQTKYSMEEVAPFFEELRDRLEAVPGVRAVAAGTQYPPVNSFAARVRLEGDRGGDSEAIRTADVTNVTTGFFRALGYTLLAGRDFDGRDRETSPPVVAINQTAARRFFPGRSAIGERVKLGEETDAPWAEVVAVVADARNRGLDLPAEPEMFVPVRQQRAGYNNQLFLLARGSGDPTALLPAVRRTIAGLDPDQPVYLIRTLETALAESMSRQRISMVLLGIFAGVALALASVGVYGIMSYTVAERTHEIGIRMSLGAAAGDVVRMVLRQSVLLASVGLAFGLAGAIALSRVLKSLLFGISATDPPTLAGVALLLLAVATAAALVPAWRASRVSPLEAMRTTG